MLNNDLIKTLESYTKNLTKVVSLVVNKGEHEKKTELLNFLNSVASVSDFIQVINVEDFTDKVHIPDLRSPISFFIAVDGKSSGLIFSGIPLGHEFNSLVLAILQAGGGSMIKLDSGIQSMIKNIDRPLKFETFISLSCHNCPDVVQALNQFALLNEGISSEMIDGGYFPDILEKENIQGVPTVFLNGEEFSHGKATTAELLDKLSHIVTLRHTEDDSKPMEEQDVIVVGAGPAGVASAIYAARKGLKVTLIAEHMGGQVKDTMAIENLISVPETTGPELTQSLITHLNNYRITTKEHFRVTTIEKGPIKTVTLSNGETITSKTLILATGAKWRELGVPGEKENIGNGVAYCPHCDGPFFKGKDVAVIGGGNSGVEAALDLAGIVKSVTIMEFLPELKADQVLIDQVKNRSNITVITNAATHAIIADNGKVTGMEYTDRISNQKKVLQVAGIFVQIGLLPNSQFLEGVVPLTDHGEIIIDDKCKTTESGIFAAGDVTTTPYKQIVIAMGEGAKAALSAHDYILMHNG